MYGRANVIPSPHITTSPGVATARFAEGHEAIHRHKYFIVQKVDLHPRHEKYLAEEYGFSPCDIALSFAGIILTAPNGHILYTQVQHVGASMDSRDMPVEVEKLFAKTDYTVFFLDNNDMARMQLFIPLANKTSLAPIIQALLKSDDYTMEDLAFALAYPSPYCETNIRGVKFIGGDKKNYSVPIDEYTVALQHIITKRGTTPLAVVHLMGGHLALEDCACSNADYLRYVHFLISMCHGRKVDEPYTNFLLPNGQPKFFVKPTNKLNTAPQTITIVYKKGLVFPPDSNAFGKARVAKTNEQVRGLGFPAEMTIDSSGRPDIARRISAWIVRPGMRLPHLCAICGLADHLDKDCKFGGDCP